MWRRFATVAAPLILAAATTQVEATSPVDVLLPGDSAAVDEELGQIVDFPVADLEPIAVLAKFQNMLKRPLVVDVAVTDRLKRATRLRENLDGLSAGTALAYFLHAAGLAFEAHAGEDARIQYVVVSPSAAGRSWPVGRAADRPAREILPALFDAGDVEFEQAPLAEALTEVGQRLKAPVLFDRPNLQKSGIDVQDRKVSLQSARLPTATILRELLQRGGVKGDWRIDERGRPFLWISAPSR